MFFKRRCLLFCREQLPRSRKEGGGKCLGELLPAGASSGPRVRPLAGPPAEARPDLCYRAPFDLFNEAELLGMCFADSEAPRLPGSLSRPQREESFFSRVKKCSFGFASL